MIAMHGSSADLSAQDGAVRDIGEGAPAFTIFVPTYNRAYCLGRALQSVADSSYKDLELVLIDDGSTDETRDLAAEWRQRGLFELHYIFQENAGKAAAHNRAVEAARGFMFLTLDSDDSLLPDALGQVQANWEAIPAEQRSDFAGVAGLLLEEDGTVSGTRYARDLIDSDFLEISTFGKVHGDKREAIRTDVLREFPYPMIPGERHVRPDLIFRRMAHKYKTRFVNIPLVIGRREPDGISHNRRHIRDQNPKGLHLAFLEEITLHDTYTEPRQLQRLHARYVRFSLHSGIGLTKQYGEVKHKLRWLASLPAGIGSWLGDKLRRFLPSVSGHRAG